MCLIFLSYNQHPKYSFIAVANRDEFYDRPAKKLHVWKEYPSILGGKDLTGGGTWLGVTSSGYFSMLTNFRDLTNIKPKAPSRGKLVLDYLIGELDPAAYLKALHLNSFAYNGYNILLGTLDDPWYYSNQGNDIVRLGTGSYGVSNALLDTKWPKLTNGKEQFNQIVSQEKLRTDSLFDMMLDKELAKDDQLPDTGIGYEKEKLLSSRFIEMPGYGTRNTTIILKDRTGNVCIKERTFNQPDNAITDVEFEFTIE